MGLPPSAKTKVALQSVFPDAVIEFSRLQQQTRQQGLFCSNWTLANLSAIAHSQPLPGHEQLDRILSAQQAAVREDYENILRKYPYMENIVSGLNRFNSV